MDAALNATPLALRLHEVFAPIARASVNAPAGIVIDLAYGFIIVAVFAQLAPALPGGTGLRKGPALRASGSSGW